MKRRDKHNYYLDIAETVLERGTCLRRNMGSIIVKNDVIVSTGYAGAPRGRANCSDIGRCKRDELNIPRGQRYEMCRSVHAEANAIIAAAREEMLDSTLYLAGRECASGALVQNLSSCDMCRRLIINAGIKTVIVRDTHDDYRVIPVSKWVGEEDDVKAPDELDTYSG